MIVVLFILIFPVSFLWAQNASDRIAAIVNDEVITLSELLTETQDELVRLKARYNGKELDRRVIQKKYQILNDLIEQKLLAQEAKAKGIGVTEEELDEAIQRVSDGGPPSPMAPARPSRDKMRKDLVLQKLLNFEVRRLVMVSPEDIRRHYQKFEDQFMESPEYRLRQILFLPNPGEDISKTKERANQIYKELQGGKSFSDYAQRYSDGPESVRGGELGFIAKHELLAPIAQALETMKIGDMSPPIETRLGVHIVILDETQGAKALSFDEVKDQIRNELFQQKMIEAQEKWLSDLKKRSYIEVKL